MEKLRYRVYFGYKPHEYIAIDEDELERALYAKIHRAWWTHGSVDGGEIKRIEPDFRTYTGWYDTYSPSSGDDFAQMERDMPPRLLFNMRLQTANNRVEYITRVNQPQLLSNIEKLDTLLLS